MAKVEKLQQFWRGCVQSTAKRCASDASPMFGGEENEALVPFWVWKKRKNHEKHPQKANLGLKIISSLVRLA